jgi:hypothetical protein
MLDSKSPSPSPVTVGFGVVEDDDAKALLAKTGKRRDWTEVKDALRQGRKLFLSDDQMSATGAKYLSLAFARKQLNRTLHVRRVTHEGQQGRLIWLGETKGD